MFNHFQDENPPLAGLGGDALGRRLAPRSIDLPAGAAEIPNTREVQFTRGGSKKSRMTHLTSKSTRNGYNNIQHTDMIRFIRAGFGDKSFTFSTKSVMNS